MLICHAQWPGGDPQTLSRGAPLPFTLCQPVTITVPCSMATGQLHNTSDPRMGGSQALRSLANPPHLNYYLRLLSTSETSLPHPWESLIPHHRQHPQRPEFLHLLALMAPLSGSCSPTASCQRSGGRRAPS